MPAPLQNEFWKLRSKHGRDKLFTTPDLLKEACYEYFIATSQRKWNRIDFRGKDADQVEIPTDTPFTLTGLCIFLGVNTQYFGDFEKGLDIKSNKVDKDFSIVIIHIREIIYTQKFEGAAVGAYNANIIARDLGLIDRSQSDATVKKIDLPATKEECDAQLEELKKKAAEDDE